MAFTIGRFHTNPDEHALTIVPGEMTLSLDVRAYDQAHLDELEEALKAPVVERLEPLQQAGGQITPFEELSSDRIAQAYIDLFELRWNKKPKGFERLTEFIGALRPLLKGHLLSIDEQPIAIQLIYVADNPALVSAEYVNGGVDLTFRQYSPGSILSYLNITLVEQIAEAAQKPFRYSFGLSDKDYKDSWCSPHPVYRT